MPFPLALPVAMSAIQSLVKFRGRLDTILALSKTTEGLPFFLPPTPTDDAPHIDNMLAFFRLPTGKDILEIRGLAARFEAVAKTPFAGNLQQDRSDLLRAYYEACNIIPETLGPGKPDPRSLVTKVPSGEMRLAYYVVESDRLSRNPAVTRVLLAAADALLEFGADNANLFVSNPRTRALIESLLTEFAVKRDWDDEGGGEIFKLLLGSAVNAAMENQSSVPDKPVLRILFAALAELKTTESDDFVATLMTREGFQNLISSCLIMAADEPALLPDQPVLQQSLVAMLRAAGKNIDGILGQPKALASVVEAGIAAAADAATPLIDKKIGNDPLLAAVLNAALKQTQDAAAQQQLFRGIADGGFFASLYKVTLQSVAANPGALASQAGLTAHVATLISACVDALVKTPLNQTASPGTVRALASRALEVLSAEPELLGVRGEFAPKLVGAALSTASQAAQNGFSREDLLEITDVVVATAATNFGLVKLDTRLQPVLSALARTLEDKGLSGLTTRENRKALLFAGLEAVVTNPEVWGNLSDKALVDPLVTGVIRAFATNPGGLFSGPALIPAFQSVLEAAARRGRTLLDNRSKPADLEIVITAALVAAKGAVGDSIDGKTLPLFLEGVVLSYLATPFDPGNPQKLAALFTQRIAALA